MRPTNTLEVQRWHLAYTTGVGEPFRLKRNLIIATVPSVIVHGREGLNAANRVGQNGTDGRCNVRRLTGHTSSD